MLVRALVQAGRVPGRGCGGRKTFVRPSARFTLVTTSLVTTSLVTASLVTATRPSDYLGPYDHTPLCDLTTMRFRNSALSGVYSTRLVLKGIL